MQMPAAPVSMPRCPGGVGERHFPHAAWFVTIVTPQGSSSRTEFLNGIAAIDPLPRCTAPRVRDGFPVMEA